MKFDIKDKVKLIAPVSYLKTSDNMPMLRPPDLVAIDEIGEILSISIKRTSSKLYFNSIGGFN